MMLLTHHYATEVGRMKVRGRRNPGYGNIAVSKARLEAGPAQIRSA